MRSATQATTEPERAPDQDLIRQARKGRRHAFDSLYERHHQEAWQLAQVVAGEAGPGVSAAVADAFVRVVREAPPRRGEQCDIRVLLLAATRETALARVQPAGDAATGAATRTPATTPTSSFAAAFWALPERWRSALWVTLALQMRAHDGALVLGTSGRGFAGVLDRADAALARRLGPALRGARLDPGVLPAPAAPIDLGDLAAARWRDATSRGARLEAAIAPIREGLQQRRVPIAATGLLVAGVLGAILFAPHRGGIGDVPVAQGGDGLGSKPNYRGRPGTGGAGGLSGADLLQNSDLVAWAAPDPAESARGGSAPADTVAFAPGDPGAPTDSANPGAPAPGGGVPFTADPGLSTGPVTSPGPTGPGPTGPGPTGPAPSGPLPSVPTTLLTTPTTLPSGTTNPTSPPPTTSTTRLPALPPPTLATTTTLPPLTLPPPTLPPPTIATTTTLPPLTLPPPTIATTTTTTVPLTTTLTTITSTVTTLATTVTTITSTVTTLSTSTSLPPPPSVI